jgi:hypothetical protein
MQRGGCVYIMTNKNNTVLYTSVTTDLIQGYSNIFQKFILAVSLPGIISKSWCTIVSTQQLKKQSRKRKESKAAAGKRK